MALDIILEFWEGRRFGAGVAEPLVPLRGYVDVRVVDAGIVLHYAARTGGEGGAEEPVFVAGEVHA